MAVTLNDDDLRDAIVAAYAGERFAMPLSEVRQPRGRRPMWISMAAVATAAAVVVGFVLVNGAGRGTTLPVGPAATSYVPPPGFHPELLPNFTREQLVADCRNAGLATMQEVLGGVSTRSDELPPLRAAATETMMGGAFVFADDRVMVQCVRYGTHLFDVAVLDISDGDAPWRNAETLPYETHVNAEIGAMMVVGWAPAGATEVDVRVGTATGEARIVEFTAPDPADPSAAFFVIALPGTDPASVSVVVNLPDRIISRFGHQPPMTMPR